MKIIRLVSMIALLLSVFVTIDLGLNTVASLISSMNDGIGNFSILHSILGIFGDGNWSHELYYRAFEISSWITYIIFSENVILSVIAYIKKV